MRSKERVLFLEIHGTHPMERYRAGTDLERVSNGYRTDKGTEIERICNAFCSVFPVRLILSGTVHVHVEPEINDKFKLTSSIKNYCINAK